MSTKIKQILIAVVVIIVAFFAFQSFFGNNTASIETSLKAENQTRQFIDGQATLVLLNKLNAITLNDSILSNPIFLNLVSFEQPIPDQVMARPNPFAPIGSEVSTTKK